MRRTTSILILLLLTFIGCSRKSWFPVVSSKIYKEVKDRSAFNLSYHKNKARMVAYNSDTSLLLKSEIDTLYLLEGYNIETARFYGTIWNKKKSISYSYFNDTLSFLSRSVFTDYQIKLVTDWNLSAIGREENVNGNWLDNNLQIGAIRTIKDGNKIKIDDISFKNFFDPIRDK